MVAGCGPKIAKCFLFVLNICLWLISLFLIGGGSYLAVKHNDYEYLFADNTLQIVSWIAIGLGLFIFVVGFSGCCGAIRESPCLLRLYFLFVLFIVLAEGSLGILSLVFSGDIVDNMTRGIQQTIANTYGDKEGATKTIDEVQESFHCCGAVGYADYKDAQYLEPGYAVPSSCCRVSGCEPGIRGEPINKEAVWEEGCVQATQDIIKTHYLAIGGASLGLIVFEIMTMVFACCVIRGINSDEYDKFV